MRVKRVELLLCLHSYSLFNVLCYDFDMLVLSILAVNLHRALQEHSVAINTTCPRLTSQMHLFARPSSYVESHFHLSIEYPVPSTGTK